MQNISAAQRDFRNVSLSKFSRASVEVNFVDGLSHEDPVGVILRDLP